MIFGLVSANFIMVLALIFKFNALPPQVPLFYSHPAGELQLVDWWGIFLIPLLMNFFFVANTIFSKKLFPSNAFVQTLTYYFKLFMIVAFTLIYLKIVFLVS